MMDLKVEDILLSKNLTKVINDDFCIFEADNFLPLDFYLALEKSFPDLLEIQQETEKVDAYNRQSLRFNISNLNKISNE